MSPEAGIALSIGSFSLAGTILAIGVFIGSFRSKFMSKAECAESKRGCDSTHSKKYDDLKNSIIKLELKIDHDIAANEERHEKKFDTIFNKISAIFDKMEEIRVDMEARENRLSNNLKTRANHG
jgi:phage host-nuclease inhibitor protein Gam